MPFFKDSAASVTAAKNTTATEERNAPDVNADGDPCYLLLRGPSPLMGRIMGWWALSLEIMPILIFSCEAVEPDSHPIDPNARIMC